MAKRDEEQFGEFLTASAASVPVFGWPELDLAKFRPSRPSLLISIAGLALGLAIGFVIAWPSNTLVYPGTQVAAWMGTPSQTLQGLSGHPVSLQSTGIPSTTQPISSLQYTRDPQTTNFSQSQPGYLDQVPGQYLQGTSNIPAR